MVTIASWNVHMFTSNNGKRSEKAVAKLLCAQRVDVACLQEATKTGAEISRRECAKLTGRGWSLIWSNSVAVLSSLPMLVEPLDKSVVKRAHRLVRVTVTPEGMPPLRVINLHLDYRSEPTRNMQLKGAAEAMGLSVTSTRSRGPMLLQTPEGPEVWAGDFNALTRMDYTAKGWAALAAARAKSKWELPVHAVTDAMKKAAFVDTWREAPNTRKGRLQTCRFPTRIDYIYCTPAVGEAGYILESSACIDVRGVSDHNLVVSTFMMRSEGLAVGDGAQEGESECSSAGG